MPTSVSHTIFWHQLTSLHAGLGRIRLATVRTQEEAAALPDALHCHILGNGTNFIGSDTDMPDSELLVKLAAAPETACTLDKASPHAVHVPAAISLTAALRQCARMGLGGLAALSGIPGTVGGALAMNAGALGHAIGDCVLQMDGWDLGKRQPWRWPHGDDGGFAYRSSPVPANILLFSCTLRLQPASPDEEMGHIEEELHRRRKSNPQGPSAGSVFRNPGDGHPAAGKLLEECGCKGLSQGNLQVSALHANWIMNLSGAPASADDALRLVTDMRQRVRERFGITLHTEWRWFDTQPDWPA